MLRRISKALAVCLGIGIVFVLLAAFANAFGQTDKALLTLALVPIVWVVVIYQAIPSKPKPEIHRSEADVAREAIAAKQIAPLLHPDKDWRREAEVFTMIALINSDQNGSDLRAHISAFCARNNIAASDDGALDHLAAQLDAAVNKAQKFNPAAAIALVRTDGATTKSWLGGQPTLGDHEWPHDDAGIALHLVAQIDLSDLSAADLPNGLPRSGALAFFVRLTRGRPTGKLVYIEHPEGEQTPLPETLVVPFTDEPKVETFRALNRRFIEPIILSAETTRSRKALMSEMATLFAINGPQHNPLFPRPLCWHQMFGVGTEIQTTVEEHEYDHLLFEFHPEESLLPNWNDNGVYQFWISAGALQQGEWDKVVMTYTCD